MAVRVTQVPAVLSVGSTSANERVTQFCLITGTANVVPAKLTQIGLVSSTHNTGLTHVTQAGVVVSAAETGNGHITQFAVVVCVPAGSFGMFQPNVCICT
jgi:hypothetical protein